MRLPIPAAALATGVPAGTIRRWLAEERICRHGTHKPYLVDPDEIDQLRDMLKRRVSLEKETG